MTEAVLKPWVQPLALPVIMEETLEAFAKDHGLSDAYSDDSTPLGNLARQVKVSTPYAVDFVSDGPMKIGERYTCADTLAEIAGRICYRSFDKGRPSAEYLQNVIECKHGSVFSHVNITFLITGISRALSLELIRHHTGTGVSQESQRYVTVGSEAEITGFNIARCVIPPKIIELDQQSSTPGVLIQEFVDDFNKSLEIYQKWRSKIKESDDELVKKQINEAARAHLPNATETRMVFSMNLRAARHIVEQRGSVHADLEIRRLAVAITKQLKKIAPLTFYDVEVYTETDGLEAVRVTNVKI